MTAHKISWLNMPGYQPETWNPIVGCSKISPGCDDCYAERMANRLAHNPKTSGKYYFTIDHNTGGWNASTHCFVDEMSRPLQWKTPRMVFVCSMGDLFHESVPFEWIDQVFTVMSDNDQHIYILLTKRSEKMLKFWQWKRVLHGIDWRPKDNVWIGVTAENQEQADKRIPILLQIPAAKHFVSIEPMLGPIYLGYYKPAEGCTEIEVNFLTGIIRIEDEEGRGVHISTKLDWVICGGESGHKARPMHPDWARSLRDQCKSAGVPFFFKQWGRLYPKCQLFANDHSMDEYFYGSVEFPSPNDPEKLNKYYVLGKSSFGIRLDNQLHHEWPKPETRNS